MGIRGPQSSAALEIPSVADLRGDARPEPPSDLTDDQAAEWRAVVERMPADWFPRETYGLLSQYCRHVVTARRIARQAFAAAAPGLSVGHRDALMGRQCRPGPKCVPSIAACPSRR
jgi:hypothetical protein